MTKTLKLKKTSPALKKGFLKHLLRHVRNYSTKRNKKHFNSKEIFSLCEFKETEIKKKTIQELPKNKAGTFKDIPMKIMVSSAHVYSQVLTDIFNNCVASGNFPDILKYAYIKYAVFKKGDTTDKTNYRPINTLSNFSKVFEKLIYAQVNSFMEPKLPKYLAGFRAKHDTQHVILKIIETWHFMLNKDNKVGPIIMDLSKAFDTLNHKLLLCKLKTFGINKIHLNFHPKLFYK